MATPDENHDVPIRDEENFFGSKPVEPSSEPRDVSRERIHSWRKIRTIVLVAVVTGLSLVFVFWLYEDLEYFLHSKTPVDLGVADDLQTMALNSNDFVKIQGIARDMCIRADLLVGRVRFFYFLGSDMGSRILIETSSGDNEKCVGAIERTFSGRVADLSSTKKYVNVVNYYRTHFPAAPQTGSLYLLEDGKTPWSEWWYPAVFLVVVALWVLNIRTLWRLYRKRKTEGSDGGLA